MTEITIKPEGDIIELINKGIRKANEVESAKHTQKHNFSPTDVSKCPRQLWYSFKGFTKTPLTDTQLKIFAIGTITHQFIQSIIPNQLCAEFRIEMDWHGFPLSGYIDSIILTKKGLRIVDYKTTKNIGFGFIENKPKEDNIKQIQLYMDATGIKESSIIYWGKDDGEMIQHDVTYSPKLIDEIIKEFRLVNNHLKDNTLPKAVFDPKNNWHCRYCSYCDHCKVNADKDITTEDQQ